MAEPYCGIVVNLYIFGRYVSISTPNWTHDAPHRPSWYPKWTWISWDDMPCTQSKMFMLDWFFHLCIMYGGPSKLRDPQPIPPDDDDDFDDDDDDTNMLSEFEVEVEKYHRRMK